MKHPFHVFFWSKEKRKHELADKNNNNNNKLGRVLLKLEPDPTRPEILSQFSGGSRRRL